MTNNKKNLLPQGFYDNIGNDAYNEIKLNFSVIEELNNFGFQLVRPSFVEFEEYLDKNFSSELFKITDPVSSKMLVIRNDITPQISRIFADRFAEEYKQNNDPLRLSYTGQVVKKVGRGKYQERQVTQTGFEVVGSANADKEAIYLSCNILKKIGLHDFTVDFSASSLLDLICVEQNISDEEKEDLSSLIELKNLSEIKKEPKFEVISNIILSYDKAYDVETSIASLDKIKELVAGEDAKKVINDLADLLNYLQTQNLSEKISLNLFEKGAFAYHTGICFSLISSKTYEEVGRGGKYSISGNDGESYDATGFTFMLNSILRSIDLHPKQLIENLKVPVI